MLTPDRLELSRKAGHEPALVGLLRVYKDYYPDIIVGDATSGRASVFLVRIYRLSAPTMQLALLLYDYEAYNDQSILIENGVRDSPRSKKPISSDQYLRPSMGKMPLKLSDEESMVRKEASLQSFRKFGPRMLWR